MIAFIQESYSQVALFLPPVVTTIFGFIWKGRAMPCLQICLFASTCSAGFYVAGGMLAEGIFISSTIGIAGFLALLVQAPISLATGGLLVLLGQGRSAWRRAKPRLYSQKRED